MATVIQMPKSGPTIESAIIGIWEKHTGDIVKKDEVLFTFETDKTSYECKSPCDGTLIEIFFEEGDEVEVFTNVCVVGTLGEDVSSYRPQKANEEEEKITHEEEKAENKNTDTSYESAFGISPRAKKFARENDVNVSGIYGTGPNGRIIENDVKNAVSNKTSTNGEFEDVKLSPMRKAIAKSMDLSLSKIPQLTHNTSFDATQILAYRKRLKEQDNENSKITIGDIVLYVVSRVLLKYGDLNANLLDDTTLRRFKSVNLGVAVDTPKGLMVPTIFDADKKSLLEISKEVKKLASMCKEGKINPEMLKGASFTVSNLGSMGVESFTPVINPPQTAILGVCAITEKIKKGEDSSYINYPSMGLSLTYDHRVIDGTPAAKFQKELCENLENLRDFLLENEERKFKKAVDGAYDVIVIGAGPGGYLCAERASESGLKVCLFEANNIGGTCLNEGCIPTKTLLNSAKIYHHAKDGEDFGIKVNDITYDHEKVIQRKDEVVKTLVSGINSQLRAHKVDVVKARAKIDSKCDKGFKIIANSKEYFATRVVIATGSKVSIPPIENISENIKSGFVITSKEALEDKNIYKNIVIIGGGVIGLEMAYYYGSIGCDVTIIEACDKIGANMGSDGAKVIMDSFNELNIKFELSSKVLKVDNGEITYEKDGNVNTKKCDKVLLCTGRKPNIDDIGLENIGVDTQNGCIKTNLQLCTNVDNVYAIGDCNGKSMLAHTAYREAEVCVNYIVGKNDKMRYDVIPSVIYTSPEYACVGYTKDEAIKNGINAKETTLPLIYSGRYVAESKNPNGFVKMISDAKNNTIIGFEMVGLYASEIIGQVTQMIDLQTDIERLKKIVFAHPTVSEILKEAIFKF